MKPKLSDIYHPGQKVTFLDVEWTVTKVQDEIASPFASAFPDVEPAVKATLYLGRVIPGGETEQCDVSSHITDLVIPKAGVTGGLAAAVGVPVNLYGYQPNFSNAKMPSLDAQRSSFAESAKAAIAAEKIIASFLVALKKLNCEIRPITEPK